MSEQSSLPGLHWPFKRSFVLYVARVDDGEILGSPDLRMSGDRTFIWPLLSQSPGSFAFDGELVLSAHAGALSCRVASPRLHVDGERAVLLISTGEAPEVPFVDLALRRGSAEAGLLAWHGTQVTLRDEALPLFAGYYGSGERFDDLRIVAPAAS